ncbi:hypothetical protein CKA55_06295 [Arcobacter suis]|uniref:Uncharacterized protein n=1 Tax=Arcobacter suis CECT 7833 TaxID=663365 RepID=A0AAD0SQ04_9BACT|nr:hypothetical protein [Arcobacter suis]AXX89511.1 hypothetical protein ASUIS_1023 [Arcobacter suis CECT 7833]RWS46613.1 hypothetical protein CKA55_06295 [Arcobacter suis]
MSKEKQLIKFITELIKNTISGDIVWREITPPTSLIEGTSNKVPICFMTTFKEKTFILYKKRYKHFTDYNEFEWGETIMISNIDYFTTNTPILWENKETIPNIRDLFNHVEEKVSGMDKFLEDLI